MDIMQILSVSDLKKNTNNRYSENNQIIYYTGFHVSSTGLETYLYFNLEYLI